MSHLIKIYAVCKFSYFRQDLRCLQIQLFSSLVLKELKLYFIRANYLPCTFYTNHQNYQLPSVFIVLQKFKVASHWSIVNFLLLGIVHGSDIA